MILPRVPGNMWEEGGTALVPVVAYLSWGQWWTVYCTPPNLSPALALWPSSHIRSHYHRLSLHIAPSPVNLQPAAYWCIPNPGYCLCIANRSGEREVKLMALCSWGWVSIKQKNCGLAWLWEAWLKLFLSQLATDFWLAKLIDGRIAAVYHLYPAPLALSFFVWKQLGSSFSSDNGNFDHEKSAHCTVITSMGLPRYLVKIRVHNPNKLLSCKMIIMT